MHNAPSVSFPVGRSRFPLSPLLVIWAGAALVLAAWAQATQADSTAVGAAIALWLACGAAAAWGWRRQAAGWLCWEGDAWRCYAGAVPEEVQQPDAVDDAAGLPGIAGHAECTLDLQSRLWVRFAGEDGRVRWWWLREQDAPAQWAALRRALFARPHHVGAGRGRGHDRGRDPGRKLERKGEGQSQNTGQNKSQNKGGSEIAR
ncbi:MAG: hypothetical protein ACO258_05380 [Burkholderiaceae bacterium]